MEAKAVQQDKVRIIVRVRPRSKNEQQDDFITVNEQDNQLLLQKTGFKQQMQFYKVLGQESTQESVSCQIEQQVDNYIAGKNTTIFAYGQTGAGKTYTIIGNQPLFDSDEVDYDKHIEALQDQDRGILIRAVEMIFLKLAQTDSQETSVWISIIEVYNEKAFDLLNLQGTKQDDLTIREQQDGTVNIPELSHYKIKDLDEAIKFIVLGLQNRVTRQNYENEKSSRSHCIFQLFLFQKKAGGSAKGQKSLLRIVDLAGSEKFKIPNNLSPQEKSMRQSELTTINGSLSTLGHCIQAMIEKTRTHVPFRNSKLTRILSDSLTGDSIVIIFICISPTLFSSQETLSTLQFANRAKKIYMANTNVNLKKSNSGINNYRKQIQELNDLVEKERTQRKHLENLLKNQRPNRAVSSNSRGDSDSQIIRLRNENTSLKALIKNLQEDIQLISQNNSGRHKEPLEYTDQRQPHFQYGTHRKQNSASSMDRNGSNSLGKRNHLQNNHFFPKSSSKSPAKFVSQRTTKQSPGKHITSSNKRPFPSTSNSKNKQEIGTHHRVPSNPIDQLVRQSREGSKDKKKDTLMDILNPYKRAAPKEKLFANIEPSPKISDQPPLDYDQEYQNVGGLVETYRQNLDRQNEVQPVHSVVPTLQPVQNVVPSLPSYKSNHFSNYLQELKQDLQAQQQKEKVPEVRTSLAQGLPPKINIPMNILNRYQKAPEEPQKQQSNMFSLTEERNSFLTTQQESSPKFQTIQQQLDNQSLIQNVNEGSQFMNNSGLSNLVQKISSTSHSQQNVHFNLPFEYASQTQDKDVDKALTDLDYFRQKDKHISHHRH